MSKIEASCHCGGVSLSVTPRPGADGTANIAFCHCASCRHVTGELFVSYHPVRDVAQSDLEGTSEYLTADGWTRYFCRVCGCHVLRSLEIDGATEWEAATGVLTGPSDTNTGDEDQTTIRYTSHVAVSSTEDGGSSVWLTELGNHPIQVQPSEQHYSEGNYHRPSVAPPDTLPASCDCATVSFHITRPDAASSLPHSPFPDLTHAYSATDPSIAANPSDKKWWLRPGGKYLAGTCACRTCRLVSGFEIQAWAFVPVSNIYFHIPSSNDTASVQLDFESLPSGILKSYRSSPDVAREFCGKCGATVFWRGVWRSELVDVSVGLLRGEGARVEGWLEWWTERVSFSEEAETGRSGAESRRARKVVDALEKGLEGRKRA